MRARAWWAVGLVACGGGSAGETTSASTTTTAVATATSAGEATAESSGLATTAVPTTAGPVPGNAPPVAAIAADKQSGPPPLAVHLSGAGSTDPDGQVVAWQWDFGDEANGDGAEVDHVYAEPGAYVATLTVVDDDGDSAKAEVAITVSGCPAFKAGVAEVDLDAPALLEASGLALSRQSPGVVWTHNDSDPDGPRVYAFAEKTGALLGTYELQGAKVNDWEDMALGPGPIAGREYLYIGDIGDNDEKRSSIKIYRAPEPPVDPGQNAVVASISGVETLEFTYDGGANNAETMLVDPRDGDLYVVTKVPMAIAEVFRAGAPLKNGVMERVADVDLGALGLATGGSVSAAGDWVVVRSYFSARMWLRSQGTPLWQAFASPPCTVPLAMEIQGEAIGFAAEGIAYFTVSEGETPPLYRFSAP